MTIAERLQDAGIHIWAEGDSLQYSGPDGAMTPGLLADLRAAKPDLLTSRAGCLCTATRWCLAHRPAVPPVHVQAGDGMRNLLDDIRAGQAWLTRNYAKLEGVPVDANPAMEDRFADVMAGWIKRERMLRRLYNFAGCITAAGRCPEESPVSCQACAAEVPGRCGTTTPGRPVHVRGGHIHHRPRRAALRVLRLEVLGTR